ncbi:MAG: metallophosphoesterase [Candidatus Thiodiazotropha sp. (ex Lucinoma borealis)]|nr:metallophosphoesterase [Candidatus Thiodiazotropha sp. (ex Lucinoma borealis)]MCU7839128.1 metallophosphoesterase [Candidatus Thiodiazotropha sp. (ex Troendleina suluensis)]MCU7856848.1 metallophosphoesterase [Candidatus Thiodiazotropha sp. (ex Lucinoma borealis)]MCU7866937.1 metallophosphoesterase [Candidatus Thiodiazotropha sp. (ex Lucinoma borealis)]MCU7871976.1 metallophosphoesterase [Candidatus Thiodiazotropha sp. (ex Lucinoma borealis)]
MSTKSITKNIKFHQKYLPVYQGLKWIEAELPTTSELWLLGKQRSVVKERGQRDSTEQLLSEVVKQEKWRWPKRELFFFSDPHADADAFIASLVASGGVKKTGKKDRDIKLTSSGRQAHFVIGGDCFDKGPSNLRLLRVVHRLKEQGAKVSILAGNHDIRIKLGIASVGMDPDPRHDHFFIRMGSKVIPMLREIVDEYLQGKSALKGIPPTRSCRRILYPPKRWFKEFPKMASWVMPDKRMARELKRLREKIDDFEVDCEKAGLTLRQVYAAVMKWQQLFLKPDGEFSWFFKQMQLAYRQGSFLFVHAGIDDRMAKLINRKGIKYINKEFKERIDDEIFEFYYGPLANLIRTKYRDVDMPLTRKGVEQMRDADIHAIVHGHANRYHGQRIMLRKGMIHFECDATIDRHTRKKEGLTGEGAAVTIIHPKRLVMGVSTDYPHIKVFDQKSFV